MNELQKGLPLVPLVEIAKVEWGNTSITKKSYVEEGYTAFSASGPDGFLQQAEWEGQAVVLSAIGARCGKCFFANGKWTAIKNTIVIQGEPDRIDHKFLYYYLNDASKWVTSGSGQPFITLKTARATLVPFPPLDQQKRIVAEIEKQFSRLDEAVANLKRVKANLKRYKAAVLKAAVEGRLVETEAGLARRESRNYETGAQLLQRILETHRSQWKGKGKYKEPAAPDTTDLPELPEGWVWTTLGALLLDIEAGKSFKCEERPPTKDEVGVVKVSAVTWGEFDEAESKTCLDRRLVNEKLLVRPDDFLFSRANTIELVGACVIAKKVTSNVMLSDKILRFRLLGGLDRWVLFNLRTKFGREEIERLATGNQESMRNIGQDRIRAIRMPLPPVDVCERIVSEIDRRLSHADEAVTQVTANLKRADILRQSVLRRAFCMSA